MTKLPYGTGPVVRLLPVLHKGKEVVCQLFPTYIVYRLKGEKKELTRIDHAVAIEAGFKVEFREKGGKL